MGEPTIKDSISLLPGVNVLLEGPTGAGKTYSIGTIVEQGLDVFCLSLESGIEALFGYWTDRGLEIPTNLHWHTLQAQTGFEALMTKAKQVGEMTQDSLYKLQDFTKGQRNYFYKVLEQLHNFTDQRTGKQFGSVITWGPDRAIIIDGLTGLGNMSMSMVIGNKPVKSQTDWGIAQDNVEPLIRKLCDECKCHFVLLAHIEREVDQITGGTRVTVSSLGKALPPKIPPMFTDVILAVRNGANWTWSTANPMADLKTRSLPVADGIKPDFKLILDKWKSRGGRFTSEVKV